MSRLFVAVVPEGLSENAELRQLLSKLKRTLSDRGQEARWVSSDLWHVTLQFLGEVADRDTVVAALNDWQPKIQGLELKLQGLGAFPDPASARVLWVGVHGNQDFLDLQADLGRHLSERGIAVEAKEFRPHLTLGRFRNLIHAGDLVQLGGRKKFGTYAVGEVVLFSGELQGGIIKYVPHARRALDASQ